VFVCVLNLCILFWLQCNYLDNEDMLISYSCSRAIAEILKNVLHLVGLKLTFLHCQVDFRCIICISISKWPTELLFRYHNNCYQLKYIVSYELSQGQIQELLTGAKKVKLSRRGQKPAAGENLFCPSILPYVSFRYTFRRRNGPYIPFHQARMAKLLARFSFLRHSPFTNAPAGTWK